MSVGKKRNVERHFTKVLSNLSRGFPAGSGLRKVTIKELKTSKTTGFVHQTSEEGQRSSLKEAQKDIHQWLQWLKRYSRTIKARQKFCLLLPMYVQLGANTVAKRVSGLSANAGHHSK